MHRFLQFLLILALLAPGLGSDGTVTAQENCPMQIGYCCYRPGLYNVFRPSSNVTRRFRYKINIESMAKLLNLSSAEIIHGVHMAAAIWNEQAAGGYFVYAGESSDPPDCGHRRGFQEYEVWVTAEKDGGTATGGTIGICNDKKWTWADKVIVYAKNNENSKGINWALVHDYDKKHEGDTYDFVSNLVHEFGHVLGLWHSPEPIKRAMMRRVGTDNMIWFRRNLYEYDLYCLHAGYLNKHQKSDRVHLRLLRAYVREQLADGHFGPQRSVYGAFATQIGLGPSTTWWGGSSPKSSMALSVDSPFSPDDQPDVSHFRWGRTDIANTFPFGEAQAFAEYMPTPPVNGTYKSAIYGSGPVVGYFKELPNIDRVFFSDWKHTDTEFKDHTVHKVLFATNLYSPDPTQKELFHCNSMGQEGQCGEDGTDRSKVFSAWPVRVALDGYSKKTVFLWVNDAGRGVKGSNNQIWVAFGPANNPNGKPSIDTLAKAHPLTHPRTGWPIRALAAPGLACKPQGIFGGRADCLVVYSDYMDPLSMSVLGLRYDAAADQVHVEEPRKILFPSIFPLIPVWTASSISAWYHTETKQFFMAYRDLWVKGVVIWADDGTGGEKWYPWDGFPDTMYDFQIPASVSVATKPNGKNIVGYVRPGRFSD